MEPIVNKDSFTRNGTRLENLTLDPFCFMVNTIAMGDAIAGVPVVKYLVENHYTTLESYYVVAKSYYRPLFPFIPDSNFRDYDLRDTVYKDHPQYINGLLNKKNQPGITRNTPKHMHLGQFASLLFADRILPDKDLQYVPLEPVDISKFAINFTNTVVLITSYRDVTRMWYPNYILGLAKWLKEQGITPVFIGKTDMDANIREGVRPKNALPDDISEYGVDLRNKTSIAELASIFRQAKAVCGLDSGPIHLAGTTSIPIVCGYTSVAPEFRIPYRPKGNTYVIAPEIECIGCESRWRSNFWNYEQCFHKHVNCCKLMTAEKFINVLKGVL